MEKIYVPKKNIGCIQSSEIEDKLFVRRSEVIKAKILSKNIPTPYYISYDLKRCNTCLIDAHSSYYKYNDFSESDKEKYQNDAIIISDSNLTNEPLVPMLGITNVNSYKGVLMLPYEFYNLVQVLHPLPIYYRGKFDREVYYLLDDFNEEDINKLHSMYIAPPSYSKYQIPNKPKVKKKRK